MTNDTQVYKDRNEYLKALWEKSHTKSVVRFRSIVNYPPTIGESYEVIPIDHPAQYLNGCVTTTTYVKSYDEATGSFETRNTIYIPQEV